MRRIRTVLTILLLATASLLGPGPTSTAAPGSTATPAPYGPPLPLLTHCGGPRQPADAAMAADGTIRGFANCASTESGSILFFRYRGGTVFSQPSPYTGRVIKVAWDGLDNTYLLFARSGPDPRIEQLYIGKWLDSTERAAPATLLTSAPAGSPRPIQGALAASAGKWWAIWTEPTATVAGAATYSLFQRHTLLSVQPRTRITWPPTGADDSAPSLAFSLPSLQPTIGRLTVIWIRKPYQGAPRGQLRLGQEFGYGWSMGPMPATVPADRPAYVDQISYVGTRYLTWPGNHSVGVAGILFGPISPTIFPSDSDVISSTVAVSGQNLFLMWGTNAGPHGPQVILSERQAGVWSHASVLPAAGEAVRVLAQGSRGRLVYWFQGTLLLRIQN